MKKCRDAKETLGRFWGFGIGVFFGKGSGILMRTTCCKHVFFAFVFFLFWLGIFKKQERGEGVWGYVLV